MTTGSGVHPACALFAVHGLLDAARTVSEAIPSLRERANLGLGPPAAGAAHGSTAGRRAEGEGIVVAVRGGPDGGVVSLSGEAHRSGMDLRGIADTALVRAGGEGRLVFQDRSGPVALAVDGRGTNTAVLRKALVARGAVFAGDELAELVVHLMAQSEQRTLMNRLLDALHRLEGGFALALLTADLLVLARDPCGFRPLCLGRRGAGWVAASEAGVLRASGVTYEREVGAGEVVVLEGASAESLHPFARSAPRPCAAEWLGATGGDARVFGVDVLGLREQVGAALALTFPARCDAVVPLPGSEALGAGFAATLGARFLPALVVGGGQVRASGSVRGLRCALLVNLLATGERTRRAVAALRMAGASEVHVRLGAMPLGGACLYGVAAPVEENLLARRFEIPRMRSWLDADSLAHLERAALLTAMGRSSGDCCDGCFSGDYPVVPLDPQVPLFPKGASV
ncbi:MAG: hypothetical protein EXR69_10235 [Myxococcales bacterium]|nr:hypothetical protein [Myxococcales bacterium]